MMWATAHLTVGGPHDVSRYIIAIVRTSFMDDRSLIYSTRIVTVL